MAQTCLTLRELDDLAARPDAARAGVQAHLDDCTACRDALARAVRHGALFDELKQATGRAATPAATAGATDVLPADYIEGYRLIAELHRGGQGDVYLAQPEDTDARVAIKIQRPTGGSALRQQLRFEREITVARALDHENIVPVLDSGTCGGRRWYAMPFVDGRQLDAWVRSEQPDVDTVLRLFLRICRAVGHAHARGVIHRDLKPGNVLVDDAGVPHVLDFGVARELDDAGERLTLPGQFAGTPAYASPEQHGGDPAALTTGADVYALGVMLHEALAGAMPYPVDGSLEAVAANVLRAAPRALRPAQGRFDWSLRAIAGKCLEKAPGDRYPSAGALADDLERYLRGEAVLSGDSPWWFLLRKGIRRHRRVIAAVALLFVLCLATVSSVLAFHFRAVSQRATAQQIQGVLDDLLRAAGPARMGGGATLLQVLEQASKRIDGTLDQSPDVQAAVQFTIGETYLDLRMSADALHHLEVALQRYRELDEAPMLARTLHSLGVAGTCRNDRRTLDWLNEALALRRARLPADAPEVLVVRRDIARAILEHPDHPDDAPARATLEELLPDLRRVCGAGHVEVARTLDALALWHLRHGDLPAGERLLREAVAVFDLPANANSPHAVVCLNRLASVVLRTGAPDRVAEAGRLLDRSSALATRLFGAAQGTWMLRQFANYHFACGQLEVSERFSRDAVAHELRFWADRRPGDRGRLLALAARLGAGHADADVHAATIESFRLFREYRGRGAYELASWLLGIAVLERARNRMAAAEDLLRESLEFECRLFGRDCPVRLDVLELLGETLVARGAHAEALPCFTEGKAILERTGRLDRPEAAALDTRIEACRRAGGGR